jgi:hypothetical protein
MLAVNINHQPCIGIDLDTYVPVNSLSLLLGLRQTIGERPKTCGPAKLLVGTGAGTVQMFRLPALALGQAEEFHALGVNYLTVLK